MSKRVKEMVGGCCVCSDERGWSENPLVYCDGAGCSVAVHQACYGIVRVPTGPWFCRKCESQERVARVKCELCPQRAGALKRTDTGGWCHVVCALYIPEACFANVQSMEPIVLNAVPQERFNKTCYICEEQKRDTKATAGACMQCNRTTCKQYFHVTCAQAQGLLCEVMGSYGNVTYCGYCSHHYKKLKSHSNVKTIPAFRPIPSENGTSDSSPEKSNPPKLHMDSQIPSKLVSGPNLAEAEKSPQVDQSVSSTSDSVLPPVNCNGRGLGSQVKREPGPVAPNCSQVADVSSAVSPTGGSGDAPVKFSCDLSGSDHSSHEPSSSGAGLTSAGITSCVRTEDTKGLPDKAAAASSSTEQLVVDVEDTGAGLLLESPSSPPAARAAPPLTKRQRVNSHNKAVKALSKKQKGGTVPLSTSGRQERLKKAIKKRRDSGGPGEASSAKLQLHSPTGAASTLPGHHDYCGNTFGGSPFFQSLSAPRRVSIPTYNTSDASFPAYEPTHLIHPPKYFPSANTTGSPYASQDRSHDMPLSMEQLLEHQWEQGAQFLMQQGEHFDISSLLNSLHKLKGENQALEDQVKELASRRDHLMLVNARLGVPLSHIDMSESDAGPPTAGVPGPGGDCGGLGGEGVAVPATLRSKASSSVGSLEDISSPDDVQTPKLTPVHIPSHSGLVVEDIVSPVETEPKSLLPILKPEKEETDSAATFSYANQVGSRQPLMYSAVNPPPPSLSVMTTRISPVLSLPPPLTLASSSSSGPSSSLSACSSLLSSVPSSSSSSPLPPPLVDLSHIPGMSSLSLDKTT